MAQMPSSSTPTTQPTTWQRAWQWFLQTVGPRHFFISFSPWVFWLALLAAILLGVGTVWSLLFAPVDYLQGNSYRIIFIHVPQASLALSIYFAMAILSIISLVWKIKTAELVARAAAPVGLVLCVLSLITGAIWGKPTWGTYWVWDGRLTSMLVLAFLYIGVVALFNAFDNNNGQPKPALLLSIIGAVNLPIIKYSVVWWNTLHQGSTFSLTSAPKMPPEMYLPLIVMMLGFYCLCAALVLHRTCTLILQREKNSQWVQAIIANPKRLHQD